MLTRHHERLGQMRHVRCYSKSLSCGTRSASCGGLGTVVAPRRGFLSYKVGGIHVRLDCLVILTLGVPIDMNKTIG